MANITGTIADEDLTGTTADDWIYGLDGRDRLFGKEGNDRLFGGAGDDFLDGGTGADTMFGGSGNDTYRVDDAGDIVSEESLAGVDDGGIDTVQSSITFTLGRFVENLTLTGLAAIDGTGNELSNRVTGNAADNTLTGGSGNDTLVGGAGNDWLIGGADRDTLTGGTGSDTFVFGRADATSADNVTDFTAEDWVGILASDYSLRVGSGLASDGTGKYTLSPAYFATVSGLTSVQGTVFGHGQFVYNTTTRALMWDADGAGTRSSGIALATFNSGVVLSAANLAIIGTPPPPPTLAVADGSPSPQTEGSATTVSFTLTLTEAAGEDVLVTYRTVNGTAVGGSDFVAVANGQATIAAGSSSTTVEVHLLDDATFEKAEAFTLEVVSAQFASGTALTITDNSGTGNIANDDPLPTAAIANGTPNPQTEGVGARIGFTVTLSAGAPENVVLTYSTVNGTAVAGSDFVGISNGQATIAAGSTSTTVWVDLINDKLTEDVEAFTLQLASAKLATSGTALGITNNTGAGTIADDEVVPTVAVADGTPSPQTESAAARIGFTVALSAAAAEDVLLTYSTVDGTAVAGSDFGGVSNGQATIAAGTTSTTVWIDLLNDSVPENLEAFTLQLSSAKLATSGRALVLTDNTATGTIADDEPVPTIAIADGTPNPQTEGTATRIGFTVALSVAAAEDVLLTYDTVNGTAGAGSDFVGVSSGQATITAGSTNATLWVDLINDSIAEGPETFTLQLASAKLATSGTVLTITDNLGTANIADNDAAPVVVGDISINDVTIAEGNSGTKTATFTVSRTGTAAFTVDFATADGTASTGDYVARSGTLNFAAGQATQTVSVTINGDKTFEGNETFFLNLTNASNGGTIADGQGLGTITNDDAAPSPSPSAPKVVAIHDMRAIGSTDPSGLAYVPQTKTLFLSDSEVEESPFNRAKNLWALGTDGSLKQSFSLVNSFTKEPTGLAFDPVTGHMFISDDDKFKVYWVDPANPTAKLGEFLTKPLGGDDPEDLAINPNNGHLFIVNGLSRTIVETNNTGTQLLSKITLPTVIDDPEALAYDALEDVFYVGGGFSYKIWKVDRGGAILNTIDTLGSYRNPTDGTRVHVKDMELAPSSDPNDNAGHLSLYVADYGGSHVDDGRLFEVNLGNLLLV